MIKTSKDNTEGFKGLKISSIKALNELNREQERCLLKLLEYRNKPFKDIWEYLEWHRQAVALELSQTQENYKFLDWKAFYIQLTKDYRNIKGEPISQEQREWQIEILHNTLELAFSKARIELAIRETRQEEE